MISVTTPPSTNAARTLAGSWEGQLNEAYIQQRACLPSLVKLVIALTALGDDFINLSIGCAVSKSFTEKQEVSMCALDKNSR